MSTEELTDSVKRVALVAERNTPVRLEFTGSELILRAGAGDDAQATESLECNFEGEALEIAFNPQYLLDGLSALGSATTTMNFTQPTRPAVLTGGAEADSDYRYLLMPVRLAG